MVVGAKLPIRLFAAILRHTAAHLSCLGATVQGIGQVNAVDQVAHQRQRAPMVRAVNERQKISPLSATNGHGEYAWEGAEGFLETPQLRCPRGAYVRP